VCPAGDSCSANFNGFAGDIEVDADIEMQLAIAPDVKNLIVYNAPNDQTGQTSLDEWTAIANADQAESVSSSWAVCENDVTSGYVQAENTVFEQMAMQGQSTFGAEGDTGAFSCIRSDGTTITNVLDPPSQPFVTSVGGTSLESANPGENEHPAYPSGVESAWNTGALCSNAAPAAANDNHGGFFWCAFTGAGGGGSSQWWGRPFYQHGPGVNNPNTTTGNGTTQCALAKQGMPCREDPDVSANADEFTPYAEFCTANAVMAVTGLAIIAIWWVTHLLSGHAAAMNPVGLYAECTIVILVVYLLTNLSLPVFMWRRHRAMFSAVRHLAVPALGSAVLVVPFIELCEPGQPSPYSTFPFIALGLIAVAAAAGGLVVHRHPSTGSSEATPIPGA
jgi:hypothetical protein